MDFFTIPILQIVKLLNLRKIIIIGHSYSGLISAHLVPLIKKRVIGVWLVCPAGFTDKNFTEVEKNKMYEQFSKKWKLGPDFMRLVAYLTFDKVILIFKIILKVDGVFHYK